MISLQPPPRVAPSHATPISSNSQLSAAFSFFKAFWLRIIAVSAVMTLPCFWHRHIEAGDLASHTYNAWLAQLIEKGHAPGLYFSSQWNNILFDLALAKLGNRFGLAVGEKMAVACCVLIFFWGVFSLIGAITGRVPWVLSPAIAMLAYGYVFNMGFFNYYLSIGLASFALALFWRGRGSDRGIAAFFLPVVLLAHPLGFLWLLSTVIYTLAGAHLRGAPRLLFPAAAISLVATFRWYLEHHPQYQADWPAQPFVLFNGADQFVLYSNNYIVLAAAAFLLGAIFAVTGFFRGREWIDQKSFRVAFELYVVSIAATALLPQNLRPTPDGAWVGLLVSRLTIISAIFGLCVLGTLAPKKWLLPAWACVAAVFFVFLYQDTSRLARLEANAETLVQDLSPGTRVLNTIIAPSDSRIDFIGHVADRACIGHCFSYGNYEPSSGQFRIRVHPGSPVVTSSSDDTEDMGAGSYEVQDEDLPMKEIYQCDDRDSLRLCIRDLVSGELNGRLGYRP